MRNVNNYYGMVKRFALPLIFALLMLPGCVKTKKFTGELDSFLENTAAGVYTLDRTSFRYDESVCQTVVNTGRKTVRLQRDDNSVSVNIRFSSFEFSANTGVRMTIEFASMTYKDSYTINAELVKMVDGKMWFWSNERQTGVLLPALEGL